jgi:transposase-like protein
MRLTMAEWTFIANHGAVLALIVLCPHCQSDEVIKGGKTKAGKQRDKCQCADYGR